VVGVQVVTRDPEPVASVRIGPRLAIRVPTERQVPALNVGVHDRFAPEPVSVIVDRPVPLVYATNVTATCVPEDPFQVRSTTRAAAVAVAGAIEVPARSTPRRAAVHGPVRRRPGSRGQPTAGDAARLVECCMRDGLHACPVSSSRTGDG
jgi:hypothetical protein